MKASFAAAAAMIAACCLGLSACAGGGGTGTRTDLEGAGSASGGLRYVEMDTSEGRIVLELDAGKAPRSVENFLAYARDGEYDGTIFHRVVRGFVVQAGGYDEALNERASRGTIVNEWGNGLRNERGTIGMAREKEPDTATREWYINLADNTRLDMPREVSGGEGYAVFGRVVEGMDVVDRIAEKQVREDPAHDMQHLPVEPVVIRSVKVLERRPS